MKRGASDFLFLIATVVPVMIIAEILVFFLFSQSPVGAVLRRSVTRVARASDGPIRIVLMSDTHIIGPQYVPGTESNPLDNESILKTPQRLAEVRDTVNAIQPTPDFGVFVGDVVHNALDASKEFDYFLKTHTALSVASDLFKGFDIPLHFLWGNHDYRVNCGHPEDSVSRVVNHKLFDVFFKMPPYHAVDVGPWKLILLNSMIGPTWDPTHEMCQTKLASYGKEQLDWLASQLQEGKPSILFMHFPPPIAARGEAPGSQWPDLLSVLLEFENVVQAYTGHYHRGLDWEELYPFPLTTLPAIRYDSDNFFMLELSEDGATHTLVDWPKNRGGARCSDTWIYSNGTMTHDVDSVETGSCGEPLVQVTSSYILRPVKHLADIPEKFNPDGSCALPLAKQLLGSCIVENAHMSSCCEIMNEAFKPSSAAFFASCMCRPSFWETLQVLFDGAGVDARDTVNTCVEQYGGLLQYLGQPGSSCPFPSGNGVVPVS